MIKCVAAFVAPDECHLFVGLEKRRCMPQHWLYTVILPARSSRIFGVQGSARLWALGFRAWGFELPSCFRRAPFSLTTCSTKSFSAFKLKLRKGKMSPRPWAIGRAIDCCMVLSSPQFCCTAAIASSRSS